MLTQSFQRFANQVMEAMPSVLGAGLLVLLGWLIARFARFALSNVLEKIGFNKITEKINFSEFLENANIKSTASKIVGQFFYWVVFLIFLVAAMETLGWKEISDEITNLIAYLPRLLASVLLFGVGLYIARFVRDFLKGATKSLGISAGKMMSGFVYYILLIIIVLTSLKQAGIDISIVTTNLTLILGAILISAGISYGFASRHILTNILSGFFSRRTFAEGQRIEMADGATGEIIEIGSISFKIKTQDGELVIPTTELVNSRVKILN